MNIIEYFSSFFSTSNLTTLFFFGLGSIGLYFFTRWILIRLVKPLVRKTPTHLDDIFLQTKVIHRISLLFPVLFFLLGIQLNLDQNFEYRVTFERITVSIVIFVLTLTLSGVINALVELSKHLPSTKDKPFKSIAQAVQIVLYSICFVLILSTLLNESPWVFLSGVGAMTAVILLIFKDSILGLVAGIQLSALDMVRVGDWIEIQSHNVDGDVMDITLNTVKVRNFDKTITMIPPYILITHAFKNYRGMMDIGARRIKRSIFIDQTSVSFADKKLIKQWEKISLLETYLSRKQSELEEERRKKPSNSDISINHRNLTNIGTFRIYIEEYLAHHPNIDKNLTLLVRQLQPTPTGIPIEIYAFTNNPEWKKFEQVQSDIFDHLLASIDQFQLRLFQSPGGFDFHSDKKGFF